MLIFAVYFNAIEFIFPILFLDWAIAMSPLSNISKLSLSSLSGLSYDYKYYIDLGVVIAR